MTTSDAAKIMDRLRENYPDLVGKIGEETRLLIRGEADGLVSAEQVGEIAILMRDIAIQHDVVKSWNNIPKAMPVEDLERVLDRRR